MKLEANVECPRCKKMIKVKVEDMRPGKKMNCPRCRTEISFTGDDGRKAQKSIDDLTKSLKKISSNNS